MFAVVPGLQGGGIGKALLAQCERIVRDDWRLPDVRMTVIDIRDELIAFYERRGYRRTGKYKPFPHGDARFGIDRKSVVSGKRVAVSVHHGGSAIIKKKK